MLRLSGEGEDVGPGMSDPQNHPESALVQACRSMALLREEHQRTDARTAELESIVQGQQLKSEERLIRLEALVEGLQQQLVSRSDSRSETGPASVSEFAAKLVQMDETLQTVQSDLNSLKSNPKEEISLTVKDEGNCSAADYDVGEEMTDKLSKHSKKQTLKDKLSKQLHSIDKWGDPEKPLPKSPLGGCLLIVLTICLAAFAVNLYLTYDEVPPVVTNEIKWSIGFGPYPVKLRCFAQDCLVSVDVGNSSGASNARCVSALPDTQRNTCVRLGPGEEVIVQTCYSLLPINGVNIQTYGPKAWQQLAPELARGLGADESKYGVATISDTISNAESITPIRTGTFVAEYVSTLNETLDEGTLGSKRNEWFTQLVSDTVYQLPNDPCSAMKANIIAQDGGTPSSTWQPSVLQMTPSFIEIIVEKPPSFIMAALGEVGGALELGEQVVVMFLLAAWKLGNAKDSGVVHTVKSWYA